jgi:long-chain fatty acid transport protein
MRTKWCAIATLSLLAISNHHADAGGLWLYEQASPDLATAGAGAASRAEDATTAFANPAGMTRLDNTQILFGMQPGFPDIRFNTDSANTTSGGNGGNAGNVFVAPASYFVHSLSDDLKLGFFLGSYVGAGLDYGDNWSGRYFVQEITFTTVSANPSIAYRITPWLSVGAGPVFSYGALKQTTAVNNGILDPGYGDGKLKVDDGDFGVAGNFGILLEPLEGTRIGVTYLTKTEYEFKDANLRNLGPNTRAAVTAGTTGSDAEIKLNVPQQALLSVHQDVTDDLAVMADFGWQNWSELGRINLSLTSTSGGNLSSKVQTRDTYHLGIGATYSSLERWRYSLGFAYDTSAFSNKNRVAAMPFDRQIRVGTGVRYDLNKDMTVGLAYQYLNLGDGKLEQSSPLGGTLSGKFKTNDIHFVDVGLNWRF